MHDKKIFWYGVGLILIYSNCMYAKFSAQLIKMYYNKGNVVLEKKDGKKAYSNIATIPEICNVVFYFSSKPIVNFVPTNKKIVGDLKQKVFIFPKAILSDAVYKKIVQKIKKENNADLDLSLKQIKKPIDGVQLIITYNPQKIMLEYKTSPSITQHRAVTFYFYSKKFKEKMEQTNDAILQLTSGKKKRELLLIADMEVPILEEQDILG